MGLEIEAVAKIKETNVKQIPRSGNRSRGKSTGKVRKEKGDRK